MNTSTLKKSLTLIAAFGIGSWSAHAQVLSNALLEGDPIAGLGNVTSITNVSINSSGQWLISINSDNPDANANSALVDNSIVVREGDNAGIPAWPAATLRFFNSMPINENGDRAHNHSLNGTAGNNDDSGIYFNNQILIQEGQASTSPGLSPGTPYIGFFRTLINESNQVVVVASIDDPAIASTTDRAMMLLTVDALGNLVSEQVIVKEGDVLPGQAQAVTDFETDNRSYAFNNSGNLIYIAKFGAAPDRAVYIDNTLIAIEGAMDPVTGRLWESLASKPVHMNEMGGYVFRGNLDGDTTTDEIIVKNGTTKVVQEGDSLPAIAPFVITGFGSGPIFIDNSDNVLWYGDWDDPDTSIDTGLFLNDQLLIQENVTMIGGLLVDTIRGVTNGFTMSDDGSYALVRVVFAGNIDGAVLIQFGSPYADSCSGDGGDQLGCTDCPCGNNSPAGTVGGCINSSGLQSRLLASGDASVSLPSGSTTDLRFALSGAPATAFCILNSGDAVAPTNMANPCFGLDSGAQSSAFDGLRCAVMNTRRHGGRSADVNGDVGVTNNPWGGEGAPAVGLANAGAGFVAGQTRYFQVIHRDDPLAICGRGLNTSQSVEVTFTP